MGCDNAQKSYAEYLENDRKLQELDKLLEKV